MGLIKGMSMADYHRHPAVSRSKLVTMMKSPLHCKFEMDRGQDEPTAAMVLGSAAHTAILEPELFDLTYVECNADGRTNEGKALKKAYAAAGKTVFKPHEMADVRGMAAAVLGHKTAGELLKDGDAELSMFWTDLDTGQECRARPDYMRCDGMLVDIKSCQSAHPDDFQKHAFNMNYHIQAAFYLDGCVSLGLAFDQFVFIAVESTAPYAVAVYVADTAFLQRGRELYQEALRKFVACQSSNVWPSYSDAPMFISLPRWA
jgi:exodeoxyribonuclease VIII